MPWQVFCEPDATSWIVTPSTTTFTGCATIDPPQSRNASSGLPDAQASKLPKSPPITETFEARMNAYLPWKFCTTTSCSPGLHSELQTASPLRPSPLPLEPMSWTWRWLAEMFRSPLSVTVAPDAGRIVTAAVLEDWEID